jgi:hypothetical protein
LLLAVRLGPDNFNNLVAVAVLVVFAQELDCL